VNFENKKGSPVNAVQANGLMGEQATIPINFSALEKRRKVFRLSGWGYFAATAVSLLFIATGFALIFTIGFLLMWLVSLSSLSHLNKLFDVVQEGKTSIPCIAKQVNLTEDIIKKDLRHMIKIGIFPTMSISGDTIQFAPVQHTLSASSNVPTSSPAKQFCSQTGKPLSVEQASHPNIEQSLTVGSSFAQKIDLNTATGLEMATVLPGVCAELGSKAVEMRTQSGDFTSVDNFNKRLDLMPHHAIQTGLFAFAESSVLQNPAQQHEGRVIDI